jgi:hypothetical protein
MDPPDAEFAADFSWNDSLGTNPMECSFDTVEGQRRISHATHEHGRFVGGQCSSRSCRLLDIRDIVIKIIVYGPAWMSMQIPLP